MTDPNAPPKPRLSTEGQLFVSARAADEWMRANTMPGLEEARRDLTEIAMSSYRIDETHARYRRRSDDLDVELTIVHDGKLIVVAAVRVREYGSGAAAAVNRKRRIVR